MSWIKIDDNFADHPKFVALSNDAVATWVRGLGYCNRHMTDGKIGLAAARLCARMPKPDKAIAELVKVGLWETTEDGFLFHNFHEWNESKATRERKMNEAKERKERWKDAKRNACGTRSSDVPNASGTQPDTRPERNAEAEAEAEAERERRAKAGTAPPLSQVGRVQPTPAAAANPAVKAIREAMAASLRLRHLAGSDLPTRIAAHSREHGFTGRHSLADVLKAMGEADSKLADLASAGDVAGDGRIVALVIGCVKAGPKPERKPTTPGRRPWDRPVQPADGPSQSRIIETTGELFDPDASPFADVGPRRAV